MTNTEGDVKMTRTDVWRMFEETGDIGYYLVYKYFANAPGMGAASALTPVSASMSTANAAAPPPEKRMRAEN
ncbi:MAG: hypothetical protein LBJ84_03550 [Oscillospiraceae bacterium]|jgi:hypothetical protein|nr:hypothetical protein [Oscillospiraceae bacterium]